MRCVVQLDVTKLGKLHRRLKLRRLDECSELLLRHADGTAADAEPVMGELPARAEGVDLGGTYSQTLSNLLDVERFHCRHGSLIFLMAFQQISCHASTASSLKMQAILGSSSGS